MSAIIAGSYAQPRLCVFAGATSVDNSTRLACCAHARAGRRRVCPGLQRTSSTEAWVFRMPHRAIRMHDHT